MKNKKLTFLLFIIYFLALNWLVLFKLQLSFNQIDRVRIINMIPLNGSVFSEVYNNIRIFVPFGIYICMLKSNWSVMKKLLSIFGLTLAFETLQFVLAIGRSDITDILANTVGGAIGIGIYEFFFKILKHRTNKFINIFALVLTSCALLFIILIFKRHRILYL
ncbi:VanZ family protein [Bacillus sp. AFS041924]|uniref:VanZ family protein n=1 Tax=Bacillus sp. AFS041924 TaxID=2033503 RepID=UPI000BFEA12A|nr:VanZ family protein [Bacillus sp. AFS041924]PGS54212.1 hypothetical protein COC46_05750 [Bacillus sp. AFS041924]